MPRGNFPNNVSRRSATGVRPLPEPTRRPDLNARSASDAKRSAQRVSGTAYRPRSERREGPGGEAPPEGPREAYCPYVERAAEGGNEAAGPLSPRAAAPRIAPDPSGEKGPDARRRPKAHARRTVRTLSVRPRAATKQ